MNYKSSIKQRRTTLESRFDIGKSPVTYGCGIENTQNSNFEHSEADRFLLQSGDQEAIRLRLLHLDSRIIELTVASDTKLNEARQHHARVMDAHEGLKRLFKERLFSEFRGRNQIGELLCAVYIYYVLGHKTGNLEYDKKVFQTPLGGRRIDAYMLDHRLAIESKMGSQSLTKRIIEEIEKDEYLLSTGELQNIHWIFYANVSKPLLQRLNRSPIVVATNWLTQEMKYRVFGDTVPEWLPI
jgi:hypothetical protein